MTHAVDDDGSYVKYQYNGMGLATRVERHPFYVMGGTTLANRTYLASATDNTYDPCGNLIESDRTDYNKDSLVAPAVFRDTYFYDSLGRLSTSIDSANQAHDYRYNSRDLLTAVADANGPHTTARQFQRRSSGGASGTCNDFGNVQVFYYDPLGRKVMDRQILTATGKGNGRGLGEPRNDQVPIMPIPDRRQGGGDGLIDTAYEYDLNGMLSALTDDNGNVTAWGYDSQNRPILEQKGNMVEVAQPGRADSPKAGWTVNTYLERTYDGEGRLATVKKEDGSTLTYAYYDNLEPCGCRSGQTGGVQYERAVYQSSAGPEGVRLDAGEWINPAGEFPALDALKSMYLLRALGRLKFDAINVGLTDLQLGEQFFRNYTAQYLQDQPNLVSANLFLGSNPKQHAFPTCKILRRRLADGRPVVLGVTGVVDRAGPGLPAPAGKNKDFFIGNPKDCLRAVIDEIQDKVDVLIVLHSGSLETSLDLIHTFPRIDCLITTGQPDDQGNVSAKAGMEKVSCVSGIKGQRIGTASLEMADSGRWRLSGAPAWIPVSDRLLKDAEIEQILVEFRSRTQEVEVKFPVGEVRQAYQGAQGCAACHQREQKQWATTLHAQALSTLVNRGQQFNPECVGCHTTGYHKDNGFYSVKHPPSQAMQNVQCEVCHGPARQHAEDQMQIQSGLGSRMQSDSYQALLDRVQKEAPPRQVPKTVCLKCHTPENDSNFDYGKKMGKIRHFQP